MRTVPRSPQGAGDDALRPHLLLVLPARLALRQAPVRALSRRHCPSECTLLTLLPLKQIPSTRLLLWCHCALGS